jgi:hypothetical protein
MITKRQTDLQKIEFLWLIFHLNDHKRLLKSLILDLEGMMLEKTSAKVSRVLNSDRDVKVRFANPLVLASIK